MIGAVALWLTGSPQAALAEGGDIPAFTEQYVFSPKPNTGATVARASDIVGDTVAYASERSAERQSVIAAVSIGGSDAAWEEFELTPPEPSALTAGFGRAVAVSPDEQTIYVASPGEQRVYGFPRGTGDWSELPRIYDAPPPPERVNATLNGYKRSFAENIAVSETSLVLGVANANVDGISNAGMVWQLDLTSGTWIALLPSIGGAIKDGILGQTVAVEGNTVVAGAVQVRSPQNSPERIGGIALWDLDRPEEPLFTSQPPNGPNECAPLAPNGGGGAFGMGVAIQHGVIYVGSPLEARHDEGAACTNADVNEGRASQGAVYRFNEELAQVGPKLVPPNGVISFGHSIAVSGNTLLAHADRLGPDATGEVLVYDASQLSDDPSQQADALAPVQSLIPDNYAGSSFGTLPYGSGISLSGGRALSIDWEGDSYLFAPLLPAVVAPTLTLDDASHIYGETGTLTATVSGDTANRYADTIEFFANGTALGGAPIVSGVATLPTAAAAFPVTQEGVPLSAHLPLLEQNGQRTGNAHVTADAVLTVHPASTTTEITAIDAVADRSGWRVTGTVSAQFGTEPTGAVTFGEQWGDQAAPLIDGEFSVILDAADPLEAIGAAATASYPGDGNHLASDGSADLPPLPEVTTPVGPLPEVTTPPGPLPDEHLRQGDDIERTGGGPAWIALAALATVLLLAGVTALAHARRAHGAAARLRNASADTL